MRSKTDRLASPGLVAGLLFVASTASAALPTGQRVEKTSPSGKGEYRIESVLTIGGPKASDEAQFYEKNGPVEVDADARGNIYVLDSGGPRVQVFDAQGRFVRTIGKAGEGPGEFKMPARLAVGADGRVAVFDMGLQRISVFDASGKLLRDQLAPEVIRDLAFDAEGRLVCAQHVPGGEGAEAFDAAGKSLWRLRPEGERPRGGRMMMFETSGETAASRLAVARGGDVLLATRETYEVRHIHEGSVVRTLVRPFERREREPMPPPQEGDNNQIIVVRRQEGGGGNPQTSVGTSHGGQGEELRLDSAEIAKLAPKFRPDVRGLVAWPDGRLWVLTAEDDGATMVTDEWSATGEWLKRFKLPRTYGRYELGADGQLYGVSHDAEDYPIVHRLNVVAAD